MCKTKMSTRFNIDPELFSFFASSRPSSVHVETFRDIVWNYYRNNRRSFLWRESITPYNVVVSEVMLQQTQTDRVAQKFEPFIANFPDFFALAHAPFAQVLMLWKGLGYNRRALNLHTMAQKITNLYGGVLPRSIEQLQQFKGIGKATARSIFTFAFNEPTVFIETNIRTVFLYFYFNDRLENSVHDDELLDLVNMTLDKECPREWYYALMDIGVWIKKTVGNQNYKSVHYKKQSSFIGSNRQLRGLILESLLERTLIEREEIMKIFDHEAHRLQFILEALISEGIVKQNGKFLYL